MTWLVQPEILYFRYILFFIIPQKEIQLVFSLGTKKSYLAIGLGNALITAKRKV